MPEPEQPDSGGTGLNTIAWDLDWNLLRTFMVIAQEQSITRAARQLNQKQPSVSNALRRLEETLGCQLAERGPRSFALTHHGEALFQECKEMFGTVGRLPNIIQDVHDNVRGHIKILMTSHVITPLLDDTLRSFHENNPKATFSISVKGSQEVIEAIQAKEGTLGICLIRDKMEGLDARLFYREHFGFFCGRNHPLFGRKNITLADLRGEQRVTFYTDRLGDVLHPIAVLRGQAQLSDAVTGVSNNLEEVRRMIMAGLGIGPLPIHVVERDILMGRLWPLLPVEKAPAVDVYTLQNPRAVLNAAEKEFLKLLDRNVRETPLAERTYGNTPYPQPL
ncbi:LysR family transcriptional regulator [Emcibacter nanhaiensis]|uniref:LysR family transcriptional regulator n=2 Tax=Emcibacter nanhaiensis TaxID=1505037 RepID=A0A501PM09_9PROT|nr:LysR family transcriptional regulator [Emcibacter nanhaiensis]